MTVSSSHIPEGCIMIANTTRRGKNAFFFKITCNLMLTYIYSDSQICM